MKLGIMQPYFVPYLGYWQLMNAVDKYVIYDDVNYIKGGWINRNRILVDNGWKYFNITMQGASSFKLINEIGLLKDERLVNKSIRMLEGSYCKAPFFEETMNVIIPILKSEKENLAEFLIDSIQIIKNYLNIDTEIIISSSIDKNNNLMGQDKVIEICKILKADEYYNSIGGMGLYSQKEFYKNGVELKFIKSKKIEYTQFGGGFIDSLSIIDVMMFNSKNEINTYLDDFIII